MTLPLDLLTCTAEAAAAEVARLLNTGVDDEIVGRIWRAYAAAVPDEEQRRAEVEALASAGPEEARQAAARALAAAGAHLPEEDRRRVLHFLERVPTNARRGLH